MSRLLPVCLVATLCVPSVGLAQEGRYYAVVVGVNAYDHEKLPALQYAVNDATEVGRVLNNAGYSVTLLTDDTGKKDARLAPTKANIERSLKTVLEGAKKGDLVLVALAGHGLQFEGEKDAYFCPSDARPLKERTNSLVSLKKVYDEMDASFAAVKVLLVDACRDDPNAGRGSRGVDADSAPPLPKGVAALFSCSAGQRAFEHEKLKHGVFFHHVLEGLSGKAKDSDGEVTFNGLSDYVAKKVKADVPVLIGGGARQLPNQKGEFVGGSPVLVGRTAAPKAPKLAVSKMTIKVPQEDAKLFIEDRETKMKGLVREFNTPELEVGKEYDYTFKVTWKPAGAAEISRTKDVRITGGKDITIDLTDSEPKLVTCKMTIKVPQEDAVLFIEGQEMKPMGLVREFQTPKLQAGKAYEFEFKVTWKPKGGAEMSRTKNFEFKGGEDFTVDLTQAN